MLIHFLLSLFIIKLRLAIKYWLNNREVILENKFDEKYWLFLLTNLLIESSITDEIPNIYYLLVSVYFISLFLSFTLTFVLLLYLFYLLHNYFDLFCLLLSLLLFYWVFLWYLLFTNLDLNMYLFNLLIHSFYSYLIFCPPYLKFIYWLTSQV